MTNKIDLTGRRIVYFKITRKTKKSFRTSGWEIADGLIFDLLSTPFLSNDVKVPDGTVGVLFSGGYDSTALMIFYLEKGFTVLPISFLFNGSKERIGRLATLKLVYPLLLAGIHNASYYCHPRHKCNSVHL